MDEDKIPRNLINILLITILIFIIQFLIFINKFPIGKVVFAGILIYLIYFSVRSTSTKNFEEKKFLKMDENWFVSEYNLTKEIP